MLLSANEIRKQFIDFFVSRAHTFVPSAPVVPHDDPTLLFTNAGMNQFKAIFLGDNSRGLKRAANSQKCMRVSGKHNDLEDVGRDHHHHTLFEMLGNWSFGDYYKKEAIGWAWELFTEVWKMPKNKIYATVYKSDDEAYDLWKNTTDIRSDHIERFGEKENFWEMGETGPCGPCSELHFDLGRGACLNEGKATHTCAVNADGCGRYVELWNLVFIQYNREKDGSLRELPNKHVDTGMGFERIVRVLQNVRSNYDTDAFKPIIDQLEVKSGRQYAFDLSGMPFRVIADHIRALTIAITDGAFPSNEGRGYVLRRLLRRAFRYGRELGFHEPFLYALVPTVCTMMGQAFPELLQRKEHVMDVIRAEEERFGQTLEQGLERFNTMVAAVRDIRGTTLSGADVFTLYDTYGFPMDLTRLMAAEQKLAVDEAGYENFMEQQKTRARDAQKKGDHSGLSDDGWKVLVAGATTIFTGYDNLTCSCKAVRIKALAGNDNDYLLVLDTTPFYAESGGQLGDSGTLTLTDKTVLSVTDTVKWNDIVVHRISSPRPLAAADFGEALVASVNVAQRQATRRNHSATHLLQAALRTVLGAHVNQSGSRVDSLSLRFDFTHHKALSSADLEQITGMVNNWVLDNVPVETQIMKTAEAKSSGATALFGEKYGDDVRVVHIGTISRELCGGTHVGRTGDIGLFYITAESSVAAGIRRIEAITGLNSVAYFAKQEKILSSTALTLKVSADKITGRVGEMLAQIALLEKECAKAAVQSAMGAVDELLLSAAKQGGVAIKNFGETTKERFTNLTNAVSDTIKDRQLNDVAVVIGATVDGAVMFAAAAGKATVARGVHCGNVMKRAAEICDGKGGGAPHRAQGGGKDTAKLAEALKAVGTLLGVVVS